MRELEPIESRFWRRVNKNGPLIVDTPCWVWVGANKSEGYGCLSIGAKGSISASRFSYELANGPIPKKHHVCHRCDNPPCVRPDHLFAATPKANSIDMSTKGRSRLGKPRPLISESMVAAIRIDRNAGFFQITLAKKYGISVKTVRKILTK